MSELTTPRMEMPEVIDTLKGLVFGTFDRTTVKERDALNMAIGLLENPCEDSISRQEALLPYAELRDDDVISVRTIRENLECLPSVQPQKVGKWIFGVTKGHGWMKCSECLVRQNGQTLTFSYCPSCGAKMKEGDADV